MFHIASEKDILKGSVTDAYFVRTMEILKHEDANPRVVCEIRAGSLPDGWEWAVFAGLGEAMGLLAALNKPIQARALPEGSLCYAQEPVMVIEGCYQDICVYETALLGLLCQATGIATRAARCKLVAEGRPVYSFGARRMHPAIAPLVDRSAFIGGCDGVSGVLSAERLGMPPVGTMPHALMLVLGDTVGAILAFDKIVSKDIPRIALIDTFADEKFEALRVAEAMGKRLNAIRLDTPSSRRGDFPRLLEEVRWELDLRGFQHVKILVSGGLTDQTIPPLNPYVDGYGVGTFISNSPVVDFSLDIVEIEDEPVAKRGKRSGKKILAVSASGERRLFPSSIKLPKGWKPLLQEMLSDGKLVGPLPSAQEIREQVLRGFEEDLR
ncbi:MAG TPA: nicotinate phosphoribosyltransferase [bacterium]|nr:nicotinate phosphoribosyltransferase [bacterium]